MNRPALLAGALLLLLPLLACSDQKPAAPDSLVRIEGALTVFSSSVEVDGPVEITVQDRAGRSHDLTMSPWTMSSDQWAILQTLSSLQLDTWIEVAGRPWPGSDGLELVELEVLALTAGGRSDTDPGAIEIPDPVVEPNHPIADTATIYCVEWNTFDADGTPAPATRALTSLAAAGFTPVNAWFPTSSSPCEAMGAVAVAYIELRSVDDRILARGFRAEPATWWIVNCGVPTLWHYVFE